MSDPLTHVVILEAKSYNCSNGTTVIRTNRTSEEIQAAYSRGAKILDCDLVETVATRFQDQKIPRSIFDRFLAAGLIEKMDWYPFTDEDYNEDGSLTMEQDMWSQLYLFLVKLGDPEFLFEEVTQTINIGGYGLFSNSY